MRAISLSKRFVRLREMAKKAKTTVFIFLFFNYEYEVVSKNVYFTVSSISATGNIVDH